MEAVAIVIRIPVPRATLVDKLVPLFVDDEDDDDDDDATATAPELELMFVLLLIMELVELTDVAEALPLPLLEESTTTTAGPATPLEEVSPALLLRPPFVTHFRSILKSELNSI